MSVHFQVLEGSIAAENPFPQFSPSRERCYKLPGKFHGQDASIPVPDSLLSMGLLFIGSAGSGKTNTMLSLASQVLSLLEKDDIAVFFDMKGDYKDIFYVDGDVSLSATDGYFVWNLFDELIPFLEDEYLLDMHIKELCQYLYKGRESSEQPYFVNAAREVTEALLRYFLLEAQESGDTSRLNNAALKGFIQGLDSSGDDNYDAYRQVLSMYERFKGTLTYIPPRDLNDRSAYGVITEITGMAGDVLAGAFGASSRTDRYVSAAGFAREGGGKALFLEYDPTLPASQSYVFRFFVDNLIASRGDPNLPTGKTYLFLDEFAMLPKLEYLDRALSHFRSKGVCVIAGLQSTEQMNARYPEATAKLILESFQSVVAFRCESSSIQWFQNMIGNARVRERTTAPGGGLEYSRPRDRKCVEDWEMRELPCGGAFVKLVDQLPFRFQFALNRIRRYED